MLHRRPWFSAVCLSVLVHLGLVAAVLGAVHHVRGVLAAVSAPPKVAHSPAWTRVSILPSSHRHEAPAAAVQAAGASARVATARTVRRPTAMTTPSMATEADAPVTSTAADEPGSTSADPGPTSASPGPVTDGPPGPAAPGPAPTPTPTVDVAALLHERLVAAAARCYPATARRFHQTGEVQLGFCLDATGGLARAEVRHPSGVPSLDAATLECVLPEAVPFPHAAAGQCFDVPVRFGLK